WLKTENCLPFGCGPRPRQVITAPLAPAKMPYFLGIDGGGTRTAAALADERGRVLARAEAGPSNPHKVGFEAAQRELLRAARRALRQARLRPRALDAVCVGLAGADRPSVHRRLLAWLRQSSPARFHLL